MNDPSEQTIRSHRRSLRRTLVTTFVVSLSVFLVLGASLLRNMAERQRGVLTAEGSVYAQRIGHRLQEWMSATQMLAAVVQQDRGAVRNFEETASSILELFPGVSALQLAPNGVIEYVYPLPGNEVVVGSDLLRSSDRRFEAHQALSRRQLVVSGPYRLIQGGIGAVGRYPIFLSNANGWSKFWGFSIVVVRMPQLLDAARVGDLAEQGYRFDLCRVLDGGECESFARRGEGPPEDPVEVRISVQNNDWRLRLSPEVGWYPPDRWISMAISSLLLAALVALIQALLIRRMQR